MWTVQRQLIKDFMRTKNFNKQPGVGFSRQSRKLCDAPFRPLGHGTGRNKSTIFSGWPNCYLASNDPYGETLHSLLSLVRADYLQIDRFISVVGSFVSLQLLLLLRPKSIHFFDMNSHQVKWAQMLCEVIAISKSPQQFISRIFARDVRAFERSRGKDCVIERKLTHFNQDCFMALPVSCRLQQETGALLSEQARATYRDILIPLQDGSKFGWFTPRLFPCEDRTKFRNSTRTGLGPQGRLPSDGFASFLYGEGWLTNNRTYNVVKQKLQSIPITWISGVDFPLAYPSDILKNDSEISNCKNLIFTMDMWSSHFAKPWSRYHTLQWRPKRGRLVVIQSITANKCELVQELVDTTETAAVRLGWRSLSDWDSSALLPMHICQMGNDILPGCRSLELDHGLPLEKQPVLCTACEKDRRLLTDLLAARPDLL